MELHKDLHLALMDLKCITGTENRKVQEFNLSTPFDLSNVTKAGMVTTFWPN